MKQDDIQQAVELALKAGATAADAVGVVQTDMTISQRLGEPEEIERSESSGIGLRVFMGQKIATACSSDASKNALEKLAEQAVAIAREGMDDPYAGLADPEQLMQGKMTDLDLIDPKGEPSIDAMREACAEAEDTARAPEAITNSEGASYTYGHSKVMIAASNGLLADYAGSSHSLSVCVLGGEGEGMQRDYAYTRARHGEDLRSGQSIGEEAAKRTLERLSPRKVSTQAVPVVFDPRIGKRMVSSFCSAISGASVARGTSFLKDKMGEKLFDASIQLIDDPHRLRGFASKPMDAEGLKTEKLELVKDGVLQHWLLDLRSARQLELNSNARASRGLGSSPSPGSTNTYFAPSDISPHALMSDIAQGLYVTDAFGGGANTVTGEFSLGVSGLWIENGVPTYPVSELTIAGTLLDMYQQLRGANDLEFDGSTCVPTLRIDGMTVAGTS